ncbi:ABC transporter permease [Thomasclavelia sp.]|uniref:ABC transporter permease n=1 Tax=Thomasclavelia sp. TaxID=3025757 RepID=UPI0025FC5A19|nr:ABC transporter permease [Thomasclavelia sp.]
MLFSLSLKNIKKSFKDYAIFFVTLILGVMIFYVFNSLESQTVMLKINDSVKEVIELMNKVMSGISVFVSFVLGFLIVYANRFLMKRRKREFGIYLTLGMSKTQISKILIVETIIIGLISLVVGLLAGIVLSQLMSIVVANMFAADMEQFTFVLSMSAMFKTCLYFSIMYLLVIIFNTIQVNSLQLIDLMIAHRQNEKIKQKNILLCLIVFICSTILLAYAYYNVTVNAANLTSSFSILLQMAYGAIATYLIYWSVAGLIIRLVTLKKNFYFHHLTSFTVKQISSKINTTVLSMTVICLLLFLTICIFSSAVALNKNANNEIDKLAPADLQMYHDAKGDQQKVIDYLKNNQKDIIKDFKEYLTFETYYSDQLTLKDTYGTLYSDVSEEFLNENERIIKISDYNKLAKYFKLPTYDLKDDEYVVIGNYRNNIEVRSLGLKEKPDIVINNVTYHSKFDECKIGFLSMQSSPMDMGVYIVPDNVVKNMSISESYLVANYNANDKESRNKIDQEMIKYRSDDLIVTTKIEIAASSLGMGAMVIFIGLYIGIVFLISCAAILALKELSECIDNKNKYQTLRKIGVDEKMINRSLFCQIGLHFAFPLILAIIHSIFGIQVCLIMLESVGELNILDAIKMTALLLVLIYGGYFIITYFCGKRIIKE